MLPLSLMEMNYRARLRTTTTSGGGKSETYETLGAAEDVRELEAGVAYGGGVDEGRELLGREAPRQGRIDRRDDGRVDRTFSSEI